MTRTVHKRADELAVGDVMVQRIPPAPGAPERVERRVVITVSFGHAPSAGFVMFARAGDLHAARLDSVNAFPETPFEVERPPRLTPAQEHADELAQRLEWVLGFVETYAREHMGPATPEFMKVRDVLARVRPPNPPTLEESLEALAVLSDGLRAINAGDWDSASMQVARNQAHEVVRRARGAGIIP